MPPLAAFYLACAVASWAAEFMTGHGLIEALRHQDPAIREQAQARLRGADAALLADILRTATNARGRELAINIAAKAGPNAFGGLLSNLGDPEIGALAGAALFRVAGPAHSAHIPKLLECARSKPAVKNYCAQALLKVSHPGAKEQAKELEAALTDADPALRASAAAALGLIGTGARRAVPALVRALADPIPAVRQQAAEALGATGGATEAVQGLRKALKDPSAEVRREARAAMRRLGA